MQSNKRDIIEIIAKELEMDPATVASDISMANAELWDSVAHADIIFALEEKYSIEFTQEETEEMYSLDEIMTVLSKKGVLA